MRRFYVAALSALLLALLGTAGAQAQTPQVVNLSVTEFMITPNTFTVTQNQPVHFVVTNTGKFPHSITFAYETKFITLFKTPIKAGESGEADFTFSEAGTWQMYCPVGQHAEAGMTGVVQVTSTSAPGMPTTGAADSTGIAGLGLLALGLVGTGVLLRRRRPARAA